jgi:hypothetical protein
MQQADDDGILSRLPKATPTIIISSTSTTTKQADEAVAAVVTTAEETSVEIITAPSKCDVCLKLLKNNQRTKQIDANLVGFIGSFGEVEKSMTVGSLRNHPKLEGFISRPPILTDGGCRAYWCDKCQSKIVPPILTAQGGGALLDPQQLEIRQQLLPQDTLTNFASSLLSSSSQLPPSSSLPRGGQKEIAAAAAPALLTTPSQDYLLLRMLTSARALRDCEALNTAGHDLTLTGVTTYVIRWFLGSAGRGHVFTLSELHNSLKSQLNAIGVKPNSRQRIGSKTEAMGGEHVAQLQIGNLSSTGVNTMVRDKAYYVKGMSDRVLSAKLLEKYTELMLRSPLPATNGDQVHALVILCIYHAWYHAIIISTIQACVWRILSLFMHSRCFILLTPSSSFVLLLHS